MYLRLINVKAIERQRDSYILVINNRYEKMGESLYRINKDALEIIRNLNGTKTFDDLVDMMISCHLEKKEQAKYKLNNFLNELEKNPGISVEYLKKTNPIEIPILGNGKTQYVFKEDIGQLFSNNYQLMNMIRGIQAPDYTSKECSGCEKKYFCSYCIIRGLVAAKEKGFENCAWYSQYIPNEFRRLLI